MPRCTHRKLHLDEAHGAPYCVVCDSCKTRWSIRSRQPSVLRFVKALPREARVHHEHVRQTVGCVMPREVITPETCRSCGACCWSMRNQDRYCDITRKDAERLPKKFVRLHVIQASMFELFSGVPPFVISTKNVKQRSGPLKGVEACVCSALKGSLMQKVECTVYKDRPNVCRTAVKPGDRNCRTIRRMLLEAT